MPSSYDIIIELQAKADQVAAAAAQISALTQQATASGGAVAAAMAQGAQSVEALGAAGQTAGGQVAAGMAQAEAGARKAGGAVDDAGKQIEDAGGKASGFQHAWEGLAGRLEEGITFGFGTEAVSKAIELLAEIPKLLVEGVEKGIEFDKEVETLGVGLAAALRQTQPEKYLSFDAARASATQAIEAIQAKSVAMGLDFKAVGEAVQTTMLPMVEGGITRIDQQIEVMTLLMQASAAKGITGFQAMRDVMDILAGRASRVILSKELGITDADVKRAQETGTLYQYLLDKLQAYREAGVATSNTFAGLWQSVQNLFSQLEGTAAKPVFDSLKQELADLKVSLDSIQARGTAVNTANFFQDLISGANTLLSKLKGINDYMKEGGGIQDAHPDWSLDAGVLQVSQQANDKILQSIRDQVTQARTASDQEAARQKLDELIAQTQKEIEQSQGAQRVAAVGLLDALTNLSNTFGIVAGSSHDAASAAGDMTNALAGSNKELAEMAAKLPGIIQGMEDAAHAAQQAQELADAPTSAARVGILQQRKSDNLQYINDQLNASGSNPYGAVTSAAEAADATRASGISDASGVAAAQKSILDIDKQITAEQQKQADQADKLAAQDTKRELTHAELSAGSKAELDAAEDKLRIYEREQALLKDGEDPAKAHADAVQEINDARQKANLEKQFTDQEKQGRKDVTQAIRDQRSEDQAADADRKTAIEQIKDQLADVKGDPFQTDAQKIPQEIALLKQELQQLQANIQARQAYIDSHQGDPTSAVRVAQMQRENVQDQRSGVQASQQMQLLGGGGLTQQLNQLENQWALTSKNIGHDITQNIETAVDGVSSAIYGLITGTKNWRQSLLEVGQSIIQMLIRIVVQQTLGRALISAINKAFGATDQATGTALAQTALANWAPAATAASIASYGAAAGAGLAAYQAAIATSAASSVAGGAVAGFAEGGLIPGRPSSKDNRIAHVATGEYIVRTAAVQRYGVDFFHRLNSMQLERTGFAAGGLVGDADGYTPILATVSAGNPTVNVGGHRVTLIQTRDRSEMLQALQSSEGKRIVLGHVRSNRTTVGIQS